MAEVINTQKKQPESLIDQLLEMMLENRSKLDNPFKKQRLYPVSGAKDMLLFKERINRARNNREKVMVAGDFDCDGMMATAILVDGLRSFGIECNYYIPNRITEGYGLSAKTVKQAHDKGYSIIITVDNGVKCTEAIEMARSLGIELIISDHHRYEQKPDTDIVLHPDRLEDHFADLCGAGLAFEMLRALGIAAERHLRWAAVASIADHVSVLNENRAIIQQGIHSFETQGDLHLSSLIGKRKLNETELAFSLIPKINSVGRLADRANVNTFIRFLLSKSPSQIESYQKQMNKLNDQRKSMTMELMEKVREQIDLSEPVLIASDPCYHEGIIGILAGKLTSTYQKPAMVGSFKNNEYRFSMRSPKGFDCMCFLEEFEGFSACGGHEQAAGFTVPQSNYAAFLDYCKNRAKTYQWDLVPPKSLALSPGDLTLETIELLDQMRPFGPGFELPLFRLEQPIISQTKDLKNGIHRKFILQNGLECLNFYQSPQDMHQHIQTIDSFLGSAQVNEFLGRKSVNFIIDQIVYH